MPPPWHSRRLVHSAHLEPHQKESMQRIETRVDVSGAVGTGETLHCAATVIVPDQLRADGATVVFGFPGGGYNRLYYDLQISGHSQYSQAEHHVRNGFVFVACDHVGVGDSDVPVNALDYAAVARANNATATAILDQLRAGSLDPGLAPLVVSVAIGIGQSFGGFLLTIGQGNKPVFDAVAMLGWSGLGTVAPWPDDTDLGAMLSLEAGNGLAHPMRAAFHLSDVPDDIVAADMTKRPGTVGSAAVWSTANSPGGPALADDRHPLLPGVVAAEAARIAVPVLIVSGETDVISDIHAEPSAYRGTRDVTAWLMADMAHMHNFASSRALLWRKLEHWYEGVVVRPA